MFHENNTMNGCEKEGERIRLHEKKESDKAKPQEEVNVDSPHIAVPMRTIIHEGGVLFMDRLEQGLYLPMRRFKCSLPVERK